MVSQCRRKPGKATCKTPRFHAPGPGLEPATRHFSDCADSHYTSREADVGSYLIIYELREREIIGNAHQFFMLVSVVTKINVCYLNREVLNFFIRCQSSSFDP